MIPNRENRFHISKETWANHKYRKIPLGSIEPTLVSVSKRERIDVPLESERTIDPSALEIQATSLTICFFALADVSTSTIFREFSIRS